MWWGRARGERFEGWNLEWFNEWRDGKPWASDTYLIICGKDDAEQALREARRVLTEWLVSMQEDELKPDSQ